MTNKPLIIVLLVLSAFLFSACGAGRKAILPETSLALVQEHITTTKQTLNNRYSIPDTLSLETAIALALQKNPELQALKMEIKAREARTFQQSLLPNPELTIELENLAGSGPLSGLKSAETTIGIGQLVELGAKRSKRVKVAALQSDLALWQYEIKRLDIITRVRSLYVRVLTAQKKTELQQKLVALARTFKNNVDTLVQGGRLSLAASARAQVELSNRELALRLSQRELNRASQLLASVWGAQSVGFKQVRGTLEQEISLPSKQHLLKALAQSPFLIRQKAIIKKQKAETALADALAIPDPIISAGYRRFNESNDQALVAALSIPLPLFDRNQGGRQEARYRERQSEQQFQVLFTRLNAEIQTRLETIRSLEREIKTLRDTILPQAQKAYRVIQQNYRLGKYRLIDVLDAQRQFFDAEGRYLQTLADLRLQIIELEGLLGRSLQSF